MMTQNENAQSSELEQGMQPPAIELELHHGQGRVDLRYSRPLMGREQVMAQHGRDGDLMAVISLPGEQGEQDKQIGVIDHGEIDPDNPRWALSIDNGTIPVKMLGKANTRYALVALNYGTPQDPRRSFVDMPEGETAKLGQEEDLTDITRASYHLGLDTKNRGNKAISGSHATVQIKDGLLLIEDHSRNGTKLISAA